VGSSDHGLNALDQVLALVIRPLHLTKRSSSVLNRGDREVGESTAPAGRLRVFDFGSNGVCAPALTHDCDVHASPF
jgi:hypothetical protein